MHVELHIFISILIIMMARSTNYLILCLLLCFLATITDSWSFQRKIASSAKSIASQSHNVDKEVALENSFSTPVQENHVRKNALKWFKHGICASTLFSVALSSFPVMHSNAADTTVVANTVDAALLATPTAATTAASEASSKALEEAIAKGRAAYKIDTYKVPYFHNNVPIKQFLGKKATLVFNMKIDDPQTSQFSEIAEVYNRYKSEGLNALSFPSDQGWFEPDDDETVRIKGKEYYGFGDYPNAVIFDKVDLLGPSANPFIESMTKALPTPNGYSRITLNYEKFLLDENGLPVRRYPRKYSAYDIEEDIKALIKGEPLPEPNQKFLRMWREAKREAVKSEYAFRFNYNYYDAPNSMYKYNPNNDVVEK